MGKPSALHQNPATISLFEETIRLASIRAYVRYIETLRGKPNALYQNPSTTNRFEKTMHLDPGALGSAPWAPGHGP